VVLVLNVGLLNGKVLGFEKSREFLLAKKITALNQFAINYSVL
jgi:hypothetical protein